MRELNEKTSPFEPVPAELFTIQGIPEKTFLALVVGHRRGETRRFCRACFMHENRLCDRLHIVCAPSEREDGRSVIVRENKEITWEV